MALVEGQPQTLGLLDLLRVYIDHRIKVVTRRSSYRLDQRRARLHLVEGLLIAILDIDEVIQVIRASDDSHAAGTKLKEVFDLSEEQTQYILELRLRRLTKFSRIELETERDELTAEIATLEALLADASLIRKTVQTELQETKAAYDTPRRTVLSGAQPTPPRAATAAENLQISDSACQVLVSGSGMAGRIDSSERPGAQAKRSPHDALLASLDTLVRGSLEPLRALGSCTSSPP